MPDHAAFLKGINLGNRRLSNDDLRGHFEALGLAEPAAFRGSGNVVFSDPEGRGDGALGELIEAGLERRLGYPVSTFIRSGRELGEIASRKPFDEATTSRLKGKLQVMFLRSRPVKRNREAALALAGEHDALAFSGGQLYWLPAAGVSDSKLDFKALERELGLVTVRTMGTIEALTKKHFAG
jgi:uncharacterized protein (DUF1697 family)